MYVDVIICELYYGISTPRVIITMYHNWANHYGFPWNWVGLVWQLKPRNINDCTLADEGNNLALTRQKHELV